MTEVSADPAPSQEAALSRLTLVRLGGAIRNFATSEVGTRAATRALFDAVVDIGADGTWTHTPTKEETR